MADRVRFREEPMEIKEASLEELRNKLDDKIPSYYSAKENFEFETASTLYEEIKAIKEEIIKRRKKIS